MIRIFWFRIAFIASLLGYIPARFLVGEIVDSLLTGFFFLSAFYFVFTDEEMPKQDNSYIPAVHYYEKKRENTYGYLMLGYLVMSAVVYSLNLNFQVLPIYILIFLLWSGYHISIMLYLSYFTPERQFVGIAADYVRMEFKRKGIESNLNRFYLSDYIRYLLAKRNGKKEKLPKTSKFLSKAEKGKIRELFEKYYNSTSEDLVSDEIKDLNDE